MLGRAAALGLGWRNSAAAISFDNRPCIGQSTHTKSLVADKLTLTLADFARPHSRPLGPRIARRVRCPTGREPPQGAATGLASLGVSEVCQAVEEFRLVFHKVFGKIFVVHVLYAV